MLSGRLAKRHTFLRSLWQHKSEQKTGLKCIYPYDLIQCPLITDSDSLYSAVHNMWPVITDVSVPCIAYRFKLTAAINFKLCV